MIGCLQLHQQATHRLRSTYQSQTSQEGPRPPPDPRDHRSATYDDFTLEEMNRKAHAAVAGLRAEASRLAGVAMRPEVLPSPFDSSPDEIDNLSQSASTVRDTDVVEPDYDWATFIHAYSVGRWDPLKTPLPPRSHLHAPTLPRTIPLDTSVGSICSDIMFDSPQLDSVPEWRPAETPSEAPSSRSALAGDFDSSASSPPERRSSQPASEPNDVPSRLSSMAQPSSPWLVLTETTAAGPSKPLKSPSIPLNLGPLSHRLRNSFADMRTTAVHQSQYDLEHSRCPITPADATATAAAIRLAAARVSVAPLALPSPEHELTDPLRGVTTATIPGSHPDAFAHPEHLPLMSPNTTRKTRLSSFWQGTQDVDESVALPCSPSTHPGSLTADDMADGMVDGDSLVPEEDAKSESESRRSSGNESFMTALPPATAPAPTVPEQPDDDYFGSIEPSRYHSPVSHTDHPPAAAPRLVADISRQASAPPFDPIPQSVPALPRRICLTRQTSAPLPTASLYERRSRSARPASQNQVNSLAGRAAKEEQMFSELGYLAPPNPPNELERRRALYKYNIWGTGPDPNFDRIAHLVKLVFNTRIVVVSLIDATEQDDEPMIILDAQEDWRFSRNPLVVGHPRVRFYAGCPLRTQDGYNIGTLAVMDDTPRREFSPRQRHTLKEFAQVSMRELELWKDKIQLRIRDRIQSSMEQFTRDCLEVDKHANEENSEVRPPASTSMEQIYIRAAKLVKRTLDVEGAIVMDVSHVDVLETVGAESSTSLTLHDADGGSESQSRSLSKEQHRKLAEFFESYPEGKVCEGIVHASLRPFLPARIQYVLGHELSYLRAIGVIILSAVLKRRMILADKAKSLFISNISHELRTPLHGILASAELLAETSLNHSQASFLQTVQACGTSLVETVNHVLDFTKLSGNAKAGGVENVIHLSRLKFTSDGYVHVMLRQLPNSGDTPPGKVKIELSVIDTGKGISQHFLKNQLFHPFSQENPLQTGTGLGLAIVNSIVRSPSVGGKVDVWSAEGVGTEIKVTFTAEPVENANEPSSQRAEFAKIFDNAPRPTISFLCFDEMVRGVELVKRVLTQYLVTDWQFPLAEEGKTGDIVVVNEDPTPVTLAIESKDASRPFIILSSARGDPRLMAIVNEYEHIGGFCRIVYKPVGPRRLISAVRLSLHALNIGKSSHTITPSGHILRPGTSSRTSSFEHADPVSSILSRRNSEETAAEHPTLKLSPQRPLLGPRAITAHPLTSWSHLPATTEQEEPESDSPPSSPRMSQMPSSQSPTVSVGTGGTLLKSSIGTMEPQGPLRVLVVEDNSILRNLLVKWLRNMGYEYREAVDGQEGVQTFETGGRFDVVLLDLSMPILDGVGATARMREIESMRRQDNQPGSQPTRILALTGMSSLEDKRRAFEAGVDG
uniref:histidine kinase n=1 Tax=Ganoderma boninense TaxID=34458 RepID=A0A5K1JUT3_9APHY|nr:Uncharacterized protein [Ganoderma boninense]